MTTSYNHAAALWQPGIWGQSSLMRQYGAPRGISFPAQIGFIETGGNIYDGDPFGTGGAIDIFPYVFNWPSSLAPSDSNGVAFPSGMLAVVVKAWLPCQRVAGPPSPPFAPPVTVAYTGTVNDGLELFWSTNIFHYPLGDVNGGGAIPVPAVLPSGYTANRQTAFASRSPVTYLNSYATPAGMTTPAWHPLVGCPLFGASSSLTTTGLSGLPEAVTIINPSTGLIKAWWKVHTGVGLRKFQINIPSVDPWIVTVSHFADGSSLNDGSPVDGDTIDFTLSGTGASGWVDCGALTPTLGTVTPFYLSVRGINGLTLSTRSSCRTDVPLPYTVPGIGDLIAPGGYV